jgi:hypothetical protein
LIQFISHKVTRVRWESTHALVPEQIAPLLPDLVAKIEKDKSVIVRDCAVLALGEYGRSGPVKVEPELKAEVRTAAQGRLDHHRANVRRLAQRLVLQKQKH